MARLGAMMAGSNPERVRQNNDFYPTPPDVTEALLDNWTSLPPRSCIWEPACGDGAISKVLEARGHIVQSTDLHPRGYGSVWSSIDFLAGGPLSNVSGTDGQPVEFGRAPQYIITNPPFKLAAEFIEHACSMELEGVAMLLKSQFWHARKRTPLFHKHRPAMVLPLTWRPDFLKQGGPTMDVMWCVWIKGWGLPPLYRPILRPGALGAAKKVRKVRGATKAVNEAAEIPGVKSRTMKVA